MKLHAVLNLYNDRTFLPAMLESIGEVVDSLIVVDGAYVQYLQHYKAFVPNAKAWSTDGSLEIIEAFKDKPEVRVFKTKDENTCWENQAVKRNFCIDQVPDGDAFLIIDADEMLMGDKMEEVKVEDWLKIWEKIGVRLLQLPKWMQKIVLDDINTAINNRIAIMEVIESVYRKNKD